MGAHSYSRAGTNTNILVLALVLVLVLARNIADVLEYLFVFVYASLYLFGIPVIFVYIGCPKVALSHKHRKGHESSRLESCEFIDRTILHRISVRTFL